MDNDVRKRSNNKTHSHNSLQTFLPFLTPSQLKVFRFCEKLALKLQKISTKKWFLSQCKNLSVVPDFIKFDPNRQSDLGDPVSDELRVAIKTGFRLTKEFEASKAELQRCVVGDLQQFACAHVEWVAKDVQFNFSKVEKLVVGQHGFDSQPPLFLDGLLVFTPAERAILSLGPKFIFPQKFDDCDIRVMFEQAAWTLGRTDTADEETMTSLKHEMNLTVKENKHNIRSLWLQKMKRKLSDNGLVVTKADKESRLVIMSRQLYDLKMLNIISSDKFIPYSAPKGRGRPSLKNPFEQAADKVKSLVNSIPNLRKHVTIGYRQPYLHGLAKTHKNDIPLRPVLSAPGSYNHDLAKFLVEGISQFSTSTFCVSDVSDFLTRFREVEFSESSVLASFDVESLFTNVPLEQTIDLICDEIFKDRLFLTIRNVILVKGQFRELLEISVKNQLFVFGGVVYQQVDGTAMGSPLGPVLANYFLSFLEKKRVDWDLRYAPSFYVRYVDDTLAIFRDEFEVCAFWEYLNSLSVLGFTFELAVDGAISFIGVMISKNGASVETNVFRRSDIQFISNKSHVPVRYKIAGVRALVHRAKRICSFSGFLDGEVLKIKDAAKAAGLSSLKVQECVESVLNSCQPTSVVDSSAPVPTSPTRWVRLPFVNHRRAASVSLLLRKSNIMPAFVCSQSLYSLFRVKEGGCPSNSGPANVVYSFVCSTCSNQYIGLTSRPLSSRIKEHTTKSSPLSVAHRAVCQSSVLASSFSVLDRAVSWIGLSVKEAIAIRKYKPFLNTKVEGRCYRLLC